MVDCWPNRDSFWKLFCCWLVGSLVTWVFVCLVQYMMFGLFDFVLGLDVNELLGNASLCQYACLIYTNPSELSVLKLNKSFHWYLYLNLPLSFIAALFSVLFFEGDIPWPMKLQRLHIPKQLLCSLSLKLENKRPAITFGKLMYYFYQDSYSTLLDFDLKTVL